MSRLEEGDHNIISGVSAFVRTYQAMVKSSPAPSAAIAYALHHFGKADSKHYNRVEYKLCLKFIFNVGNVWNHSGRRGKYIKTNSGGIQRRRKNLSRGTKLAPQGRPTKRNLQDPQTMPPKPKRA